MSVGVAERRISPDGKYEWDGKEWQSTSPAPTNSPASERRISPDGRHEWDGAQWNPVAAPIQQPEPAQPIQQPKPTPQPQAQQPGPTPQAQQPESVPQQPAPPKPKEYEFEGTVYRFSPNRSRESIQRWFDKQFAARRTLNPTQAGGRSLPIDAEKHTKLRQSIGLSEQGMAEYAELFSGEDEQGSPIVVKPEDVTPQLLKEVIEQRETLAEEAENVDPIGLREFEEDTASMKRDLGRLWPNETTLEAKRRLAVARGDDPSKEKRTASATARDEAILAKRGSRISAAETQMSATAIRETAKQVFKDEMITLPDGSKIQPNHLDRMRAAEGLAKLPEKAADDPKMVAANVTSELMRSNVATRDTWMMAMGWTAMRAADKIAAGDTSAEHYIAVATFLEEERKLSAQYGRMPFAQKVVEGLAGTLEWMGALVSGAPGKQLVEKAITKGAKKSLARKVMGIAGEEVARLAVAPGLQQKVIERAVGRMAPQYSGDGGLDSGDPFIEAFAKAIPEQLISQLTERSGGLLCKLPGMKQLKTAMAKATGRKLGSIRTAAEWNGLLGELGEERVEELAQGIFSGVIGEGFQFGPTADLLSGDPERMKQGLEEFAIEGLVLGAVSGPGTVADISARRARVKGLKPLYDKWTKGGSAIKAVTGIDILDEAIPREAVFAWSLQQEHATAVNELLKIDSPSREEWRKAGLLPATTSVRQQLVKDLRQLKEIQDKAAVEEQLQGAEGIAREPEPTGREPTPPPEVSRVDETLPTPPPPAVADVAEPDEIAEMFAGVEGDIDLVGPEGEVETTAPETPVEPQAEEVTEDDITFKTGAPVEFPYTRNTEPAPNMGREYQQDIEPTGRYMQHVPPAENIATGWEQGTVRFENPLLIPLNSDPSGPIYNETSWKAVLSRKYGDKTGKALTSAIRADGFDGIVTYDTDEAGHPRGTREIVDLTEAALPPDATEMPVGPVPAKRTPEPLAPAETPPAAAQEPEAAPEASVDDTWVSISPAKYAKDSMAVQTKSIQGMKSRAARLAEALKGRYSGRENAYIISKTKAAKIEKMLDEGWDGSSINKELIPPEGITDYSGLDLQQLSAIAKQRGLEGYSGKKKAVLLAMLEAKPTAIQQAQVDSAIQGAEQAGEETTLYQDKKGNILVATEYEHGLSRAVFGKDGSVKSLGAGPVDEKTWTRTEKPEAVPPVSEKPEGVKEPWQMTRGEYVGQQPEHLQEAVGNSHKRDVSRALSEEKPVPPEVLADYPDLVSEAPAETKEAHTQLPMWNIYPTTSKGKKKYAVKVSDKGGFGDPVFDTEADAQEHAMLSRQRQESERARQQKAETKETEAAREQEEYETSFQGFLSDDPKTKGRQLKTLEKSLMYDGRLVTRKALIEGKVADGWKVNDEGQLQSPKGQFLDQRDLTKTGVDYARHLVSPTPKPVVQEAKETAAPKYGASNKIVTQSEYEKERENILRSARGEKPLVGIDPSLLKSAVKIGLYHLEAGTRSFAAWAAKMADDFGHDIHQHLPQLWEQIRNRVDSAKPITEEEVQAIVQKIGAPHGPSDTTGVKNIKTDELREKAGLGERVRSEKESIKQWEEEATRRHTEDPTYRQRLAEEIAESSRETEPEEQRALGQYLRDLENRRRAGEDVRNELLVAIDAAEVSGKALGQAFRARQETLAPDFSVVGIVRQHKDATGEQPTDEQMDEYEKLADQITELEAKLEESEQKRVQVEVERRVAEAAKKKSIPRPKKGTKKERLQREASESVAEFKDAWASLFEAGAVYDPKREAEKQIKIAKLAAKVVQKHLAMGVNSLMEFVAKVRSEMGGITDAQAKVFKDEWGKANVESPLPDNPEKSEIGTRAQHLTKQAVESGIEEREEVIDAVHEQLSQEVPDITRSDTMEAMSGYGEFRELPGDDVSVIVRGIRGEIQQLLKLEDMEAGRAPRKTGSERRDPTEDERQLIKDVNEAKKRGGYEVTDPVKQLKSALGTAKTSVNNRLTDLDAEIKAIKESIDKKVPLKKPKETTPLKEDTELTGLRKELTERRRQRDDLKDEYNRLFPKKKTGLNDAQRLKAAESLLDRQITELEADAKAGRLRPKDKAAPVTSPELDVKRQIKADLIAARDQAREASPEYQAQEQARQMARYKKSLEKRLAFWETRLAEAKAGKKPKKRKPTPEDEDVLDKKLEIEKVQYEVLAAIEKNKRAEWNVGQWIGHGLLETTSLIPKSLMLGMEWSFFKRQGFFYARSHPLKAFAAAVEAMQASFSERIGLAAMENIENRPDAKEYHQGGVEFTHESGPRNRLEEVYQSGALRWLTNTEGILFLPLRTWAKLYMIFERGNRSFANTMKADMYDIAKRDTMAAREFFKDNKPWTKEDIKLVGRTSNIFSGRGTGLKGGNPWLDFFFLARRWAWSRIQADFVVPFQTATPQWLGQWNADRGMRVSMAKLYIQTLMGHATKMAITYWLYMLMAGDDEEKKPTVEWDLRSSDAWALKMGETRVKDEGGTMPAVVLAARILTGEMKTGKGEIKSIYGEDVQYGGMTAADFIVNYGKYKIGTGPSAILEWASGRDAVGNVVTKTDIVVSRITPLTWREIVDAERELGVKQGTLAALEAFFGASVSTYGPGTKYRKADKEKRKELFEKDLEKMEWNSGPPAYSEFLTPKQMEQLDKRIKRKKYSLTYDATAKKPVRAMKKSDKDYEQDLRKWEKNREQFREMRETEKVSYEEARGLLKWHLAYEAGLRDEQAAVARALKRKNAPPPITGEKARTRKSDGAPLGHLVKGQYNRSTDAWLDHSNALAKIYGKPPPYPGRLRK